MRRKYDPWTMGNSEIPPLKKIHEDMEKSNKTLLESLAALLWLLIKGFLYILFFIPFIAPYKLFKSGHKTAGIVYVVIEVIVFSVLSIL